MTSRVRAELPLPRAFAASVLHRPGQILALFCHVQVKGLVDQLESVLPLAVEWASEQEQRILLEGRPLSESELADAKVAGVRHPEWVRVLSVEAIPSPSHPILKTASEQIELLPSAPSGLSVPVWVFRPALPPARPKPRRSRTGAHGADTNGSADLSRFCADIFSNALRLATARRH